MTEHHKGLGRAKKLLLQKCYKHNKISLYRYIHIDCRREGDEICEQQGWGFNFNFNFNFKT